MATKKTVKKVDPKKLAKVETVSNLVEFFEGQGLDVSNGVDFGFTDTTIVLHLEQTDVQIKLITPSAKNGTRYEKIDEE